MQVAVLNAAADYKRETGNKLQVNSAKRSIEDQTRLYNTSVRNGTPGVQPNGRLVARPNPNAPHMRGNAIDLQQGISDTARTNRILARHKLINDFGRRDLPHYELKARDGGIMSGPSTGYPVEMHGTELIIPIDANSILSKLASTSAESVAKDLQRKVVKAVPKPTSTTGIPKKTIGISKEMIYALSTKFDTVVNKIESTNHVQKKLLKQVL
jgi:hypothetical protein